MNEEHLSESTVAAYIDGRLPRVERRHAEAHLAECQGCRAEVVAVTGLVKTQRRSVKMWLPFAAAASIAVVAIALNRPTNDERPVLRGAELPAAVHATTPVSGAGVDLPAQFVWLRAGDALEYRVTITDAAGSIVAEQVTTDTTARFASLPSATYRWSVTAILSTGSVISSGLQSVTVR